MAQAGGSRGVVVFVDDWPWASTFQLSSRLRRLGWHTVRVATHRGRAAAVASRLAFDEYHEALGESAVEVLRRVVAGRPLADLQFTELVCDLVAEVLPDLDESLASRLAWRITLMDKVSGGEAMASAGIRVAERSPIPESLDEVGARLGYPVVLKGREGYGGASVSIVPDEASLRTALTGEVASDFFLERYLPGERLNYAAIVGADGGLCEICYRTAESHSQNGPSTVIEVIDDAEVLRLGRLAATVARGPGLLGLNFMRPPGGGTFLIDINPRAFGGVSLFAEVGADLVAAYDAALRGEPISASQPKLGSLMDVFPMSADQALLKGDWVRAVRLFVSGLRRIVSTHGVREALADTALAAVRARGSLRSRRRDRPPRPGRGLSTSTT